MRYVLLIVLLMGCSTKYDAICDTDADGYEDTECGGDDCDDLDPLTNPGAEEQCNGLDDNCSGATGDEFNPAPGELREFDQDGDGFLWCEDCNPGNGHWQDDCSDAG